MKHSVNEFDHTNNSDKDYSLELQTLRISCVLAVLSVYSRKVTTLRKNVTLSIISFLFTQAAVSNDNRKAEARDRRTGRSIKSDRPRLGESFFLAHR